MPDENASAQARIATQRGLFKEIWSRGWVNH